jgi:hypothetical protein
VIHVFGDMIYDNEPTMPQPFSMTGTERGNIMIHNMYYHPCGAKGHGHKTLNFGDIEEEGLLLRYLSSPK